MPQLDADCYLGVNFVRAFRAVLDLDTDRLFCMEAEAYVKLEVASFTTDPIAVSATGANAASDHQRERLKAKVKNERLNRDLQPASGCDELSKDHGRSWLEI